MPNLTCKIFVNTLTTIFNRIRKTKKSVDSRRRKNELLRTFSSSHSVPIPSYNNCTRRGITTCITSPQDSSRYEEYVCLNRSNYDIFDVTDTQLQTIAA